MLDELRLTLPGLDKSHFTTLRRAKNTVAKKSSLSSGNTSQLEKTIKRLREVLGDEEEKDLASYIESSNCVRAFAKLLAQETESSRLLITDKTIKAIEYPTNPIKRQTLLLFIEAFLTKYDETMDKDTLIRLGGFINSKLTSFKKEKRQSVLSILANNPLPIFSLDGPKALVSWSRDCGVDLVDGFERNGLNDFCEGRFFTLSRYLYYLEELRAIPVGSNHQILEEITDKKVYLSPGDGVPHLGHEILSILIDRSSDSGLSDEWMRVIMDIAGDPRVPESSPGHRLWWSRLGQERIKLMRGWLSKLDLKLFLKVLHDYGNSSNDVDLQRMYPARKRFLEGLIDQGLVTNSRLFINPSAERFLKRGYKKEDLPEYAIVNDSKRSMIYLRVGQLHMIEGSHSFKLWIFPKLPAASKILNYHQMNYTPADLSSEIDSEYSKEFGRKSVKPATIIHSPVNFSWQHKAITYLKRQGVNIDIEKLFSQQDYVKYIRLKGL